MPQLDHASTFLLGMLVMACIIAGCGFANKLWDFWDYLRRVNRGTHASQHIVDQALRSVDRVEEHQRQIRGMAPPAEGRHHGPAPTPRASAAYGEGTTLVLDDGRVTKGPWGPH